MNFRENLVHLRAVNNLTQEQLAMMLGVSRQSVAKWEEGKSNPEMDKLLGFCRIFNCALDELVQGDLTGKEADQAVVVYVSAKPEDVFGYDDVMRTFADKISGGVMAIILGVAVCTLLGGLGDGDASTSPGATNLLTALGVLGLFAGVGVGLAFLIPAGLAHSTFVKAHPYIDDFYTNEDRARARSLFSWELVGGICCILVGVCFSVFMSIGGNGNASDTVITYGPLSVSSDYDIWGATILLILIAIGVRFIIHGGMTLGRVDLDAYNKRAGELVTPEEIELANVSAEQKRQLHAARQTDKRFGAVCGAIMMIATIAGLVILFVPGYQTPYFWLAWPIGGLSCGIFATLYKAFSRG